MPRVLVVDDTQMVLRFLAAVIMSAGHEVTAVASSAAAVAAISTSEPFDLLVLDYEIGGDIGTNVYTAAVMRTRALADRAIFVTGNPSAVPTIRAVAPSAPVLLKPFDFDALLSAVATVLTMRDPTAPRCRVC